MASELDGALLKGMGHELGIVCDALRGLDLLLATARTEKLQPTELAALLDCISVRADQLLAGFPG